MVGSLTCRDLESGLEITVSPGELDHAERRHFFVNPQEIVGKTITFKKGVKTLPRFPTFKNIRSAEDMEQK